jgi:hypothetical protein
MIGNAQVVGLVERIAKELICDVVAADARLESARAS